MLTVGRNPGEYLMIGNEITVMVVSVDGQLRLAVDAPKEMSIQRGELYEQNHRPPQCIRDKSVKSRKSRKKESEHESVL